MSGAPPADDAVFEAVRALVGAGPALAPAPPAAIREAVRTLGAPLPPLLRRLYAELGNGGFGPGDGLLGLRGGHEDHRGHDAVALFAGWTRHVRRERLLPVCSWGHAVYSLVDVGTPDGTMWLREPRPDADQDLFPEALTFTEWMARWAGGRLRRPAAVCDDATGVWRAATQEEL